MTIYLKLQSKITISDNFEHFKAKSNTQFYLLNDERKHFVACLVILDMNEICDINKKIQSIYELDRRL